MKYKIGNKEIRNGIPGDDDFCPVALTLRSHFAKASVGESEISTSSPDQWSKETIIPMSDDLQKWIIDYDIGIKVEPIEIELFQQSNGFPEIWRIAKEGA